MVATARLVTATPVELHDRIDAAQRRFVELVRAVPADLVVSGAWTARDVLAHVVTVMHRYADYGPHRLVDTPRGVDALNDDELRDLDGLGVEDLVTRLGVEMEGFRRRFGGDLDLDARLPFHGGGTIDGQSGLTNVIGEHLVHGFDIAKAAGRSWPMDERDALLLLAFAMDILPSYVQRARRGRVTARIEVPGAAPWILEARDGSGSSRPAAPGDRPDVVLRGPAEALVLNLYGRIGVLGSFRRGLRVVGGRRPWLGLTFSERFERP